MAKGLREGELEATGSESAGRRARAQEAMRAFEEKEVAGRLEPTLGTLIVGQIEKKRPKR